MRRVVSALVAVAVAAIGAIVLYAINAGEAQPAWSATSRAEPPASTATGASTRSSTNASNPLALAADAPVLGMIRVEALPRVPLPLADVLPARVVYDEDRTARVNVAFTGRIARLIASPGDRVAVGAPLAEVDSPDFGLAAADLAKARADAERKRLTLSRSRDLLSGGVIPQKDVESAQADYAQAQAETTRAALRVRNLVPAGASTKGEHFPITSPITGVVTERNANPSMEVNPTLALPLFVVSDLSRLWVLIDLPERLLGSVTNGSRVTLESDAYPGRTFDATIVHIAQILDPTTRRIAVRARVDNADLKLRPEMFVRATLLREQGTGVRVPNAALVDDGLYSDVYVEDGDHAYRRVRVTPVVKGAEYTYVDGGLVGGERVVVAGALLLTAERGHDR